MLLSRPSYVINGSLESLVTPALCNTPIPIPNRSSSRARFGTLVYGSPSPIHCKYIVIIIASGREPAINLGKATHLEMDWQINLSGAECSLHGNHMVESQGGANLWLRQLFGVPMSGQADAMVNKLGWDWY